jgi:hypothetical protein
MAPNRAEHKSWDPPSGEPVEATDPADRRTTPTARPLGHRALEVVFLIGLAGVFFVNAAVAAVQPSDFVSLVEDSSVGRWLGLTAAGWVAPLIFVNDLLLGLAVVCALWARPGVRAAILAWAGLWLFAVTVVKLTALNVLP